MTLKPCDATGCKLPDYQSCGGLCDIFPDCMPPPSPELVSSVMVLRATLVQENAQNRAAMQSLRVLQRAISDRIERESQ
jgi:hypothetical protein